MMPMGWFSMIALSMATCRWRSFTSDSILLVSALRRAADSLPPHDLTWSVITRLHLKRSTFRRREEGHGPIRGGAGSAGPDRDDPDGDISTEQGEPSVRCRLGGNSLREEIVHELGEHALDDLLPDPGHRHGAFRAGVQARADERGIANSARHHERRPACRGSRGKPAATISSDRADRIVKFHPSPPARVPREPAGPHLGQGFLEALT